MEEGGGWHSRGYLPHVDLENRAQFLTWRLDDALPAHVYLGWKQELASETDMRRKKELARRVEAYCDAGHGSCLLRHPNAANAVQDVLLAHHNALYRLHAWSVMPNHVHCLFSPMPGFALKTILQQMKGESSRTVNLATKRKGRLWEVECFDRMIRNEKHFERVAHYIEWNPVKAKLCIDPQHWGWSSACPESARRLAEKNSGQ